MRIVSHPSSLGSELTLARPRKSVGWKPHATFASEMGLTGDGAHMPVKAGGAHAADEKAHTAAGTKHVQETETTAQAPAPAQEQV